MSSHLSDCITFTVPLTTEAHRKAKEFCYRHRNTALTKQVYLNSLAVFAVDFYLRCMGFNTAWDQSDSYHPVVQTLIDVADLEVVGAGKLECRRVLPGDRSIYIPPEVRSDRIGYVAVALSESLRQATILGWKATAPQQEELELEKLRSLEDFLVYLSEATSQKKQPTHLSQWFVHVFEVPWKSVESLIDPDEPELAFKFRSGDNNLAIEQENSNLGMQRGKLLDFGGLALGKPIALVVGLKPAEQLEMNIYVKVFPIGCEKYLPEALSLFVLDDQGICVMQAQARTTKSIQLNFSSEIGERFSVKIGLGDVSFTEDFLV